MKSSSAESLASSRETSPSEPMPAYHEVNPSVAATVMVFVSQP